MKDEAAPGGGGGTCVPDGWCTVGEGGVAATSPERTNYRVMARLDESHVRVMIL